MAERLALPTSDHGVTGSNPTGGEILPEPKRRFIAQSLSCSPFHHFEMTEILLKWCKTLTHPSIIIIIKWTASSEFGTYRLCEQRRFRRACASAQSRQNLRCSLIQAVSQEEPSDRKPDPWPLWMAGHAQLQFVMTECSKTQIRLTGLKFSCRSQWSGRGHKHLGSFQEKRKQTFRQSYAR